MTAPITVPNRRLLFTLVQGSAAKQELVVDGGLIESEIGARK